MTYLLPVTERLWHQQLQKKNPCGGQFVLVFTPTRELAAQVYGVAQALAPPRSIRFIRFPTNLFKSDEEGGGSHPTIYVGSAKAIYQSLYGDGGKQLTVPPTSKPEAMFFLKNVVD